MMLTSTLRRTAVRQLQLQHRTLVALPGASPLHVLQQECFQRGFCDEDGKRKQGVDWRIALAIALPNSTMAPNLRTVTVERISEQGIDFCLKRTSPIAQALSDATKQVSFLHTRGSFVPGNSAEQWRGEGPCGEIDIDEVADLIPRFTLTSIVGSTRFQKEKADGLGKGNLEPPQVSENRSDIHTGKSRLTEIMLQTRNQVDAGEISKEELQECIKPMRLQPLRMECMIARPETSIMWDRWEWLRIDSQGMDWNDPKHLVPH